MRVRALDVLAAKIDGTSLALGSCTLAARTMSDGSLDWEASGWLERPEAPLSARDEARSPLPVVLETDSGTLTGSAYVSVGRAPAHPQRGASVLFVGVGRLDPWPG